MPDKVTIQEIESYLWGSANYLRNKIDAGDYKAYIFPLMFYKRICDVYDDEYQKALKESNGDVEYAASEVNHQFQIPKGSHWNDLRKVTKDVGQKILKSMRAIEKANPDLLYGIFGDANWGNKDRLSDETLVNLVEHFSKLNLSNKTVPDDLMGIGYEYLIKKFADDSGHTAAEFYTNRTVVTLMTELLDPQPGESVYDPTCGTGGMLLECVNHLKRQNKEYRSLRLFGQEKNVITSTIARMNMLLHGFEDAKIRRGDTLSEPLFLEGDKLQKFDVILANPPYSVNRWNREAFSRDPYGRNIYGTPPQGRADFAFIQHIISSLDKKRGRAAILLPHGVLFRDGEAEIRQKLIKDDKLEAVIGLGPNLFYNSSMESCIMILQTNKKPDRKNKVLFVNALDQIARYGTFTYLSEQNIKTIFDIYKNFKTVEERSYLAKFDEIESNDFLFSIPLYVKAKNPSMIDDPTEFVSIWFESSKKIAKSIPQMLKVIGDIKNSSKC
jgi:type I restriction enzyme M protein